MTWIKVDDHLHSHPKVKSAWQQHIGALGLHLLALSYCGMYLTDGYVPYAFICEKVPNVRLRRNILDALVDGHGYDVGMWEPDHTSGYWIHDYLKYNDSREKILARRAADSRRKVA